jgi:hypothetical protein
MFLEHADPFFRELARQWIDQQKIMEKKSRDQDEWKDYFNF